MLWDVNLSCGWTWPWPLGHVYPWMSRKASVREVNMLLWRMQRCPFSVERLFAIPIVDGNVCVNMWETAYALPVWRRTHGGRSWVLAWRVQKWLFILCDLLQETNHVKNVMKSLIVGTTSLYIGWVRNCATGCSRIPYFGTCLVRNDRTCMHLACLSLVWSPCCLLLRFSKIYLCFCTKIYSAGTWKFWNSSDELCIGCLRIWILFEQCSVPPTLELLWAELVQTELPICSSSWVDVVLTEASHFIFPW